MKATVYLSLGSNLGKRAHYLYLALSALNHSANIRVKDVSSIYETEPVGFLEQPPFLNMAAELETCLTPFQLLHVIQKIEGIYGRKREIKWGPRTIDLDILLFNDKNIKSERLEIPHPRMFTRKFVLIPLCEINPDVIHPLTGEPIRVLLSQFREKSEVTLWKQRGETGAFRRLFDP